MGTRPSALRTRFGIPATTLWGETWRLLVATGIGIVAWAAGWATIELDARQGPDWWMLFVDPALGLVAVLLLLLRRRYPVSVAATTALLSATALTGGGAAVVALAAVATRRKWRELAFTSLLFLATGMVWDLMFRPEEPTPSLYITALVMQVLVAVACVAVGYSIGTRRENLASLQLRAETAEREQARRVEQARATERSLIAREMHDVLAHRISLIAMNAGALNYREDLPPEQVREIAAMLRDNADQAVTELREVLGVLRGGEGPGQPRGPQPDLHHLADLLAETSDSGPPVVSNLRVDPALVPETISRHAYRIIQEGLTNARKHAPGQPVTVALSGGAGVGLDLTVVNQPRRYGGTPSEDAVRNSGSGLGLLGLAERAALSGGQLSYGTDRSGRFVVRAWLPWPT